MSYSVNTNKQNALDAITRFDGIPPRGLLAVLAGVTTNTLNEWEKDDEPFKEELKTILEEKKLKVAKKLYKGFDKCIDEGHYPAIRDGLKAVDPQTWGETEQQTRPPSPVYLIGIYNETKILMQQTNGKNGKPKEIEGDKND